jgi:GNAT superfamily N-acetyltransferase
MKIRSILPDECDALGEITVAAFRQLMAGEALGGYEEVLRDVASRSDDCDVIVAVGANDHVVMGGVTYVPDANRSMSEFSDPDAAGIRMLAVDPEHQGAGIGGALVEACIARARAQHRKRIILHSTTVMEVARAMYEQLGFDTAPEQDVWVTEEPYSAQNPLHLIAYVLTL